MYHTWMGLEVNTKYYLVNPKGRDHLLDLAIDERIILKWALNKYSVKIWTGFI